MPTYEQLERAYQNDKAALMVNQINHREFLKGGFIYFCCWSSKAGEIGWHVYKKMKK